MPTAASNVGKFPEAGVKLLREPLTLEKSCPVMEAKKEPKMTSDNKARLRVAALIFVMVNAVVFGDRR